MRESWESIFMGSKFNIKPEQSELMDQIDEIEEGNQLLDFIEEK